MAVAITAKISLRILILLAQPPVANVTNENRNSFHQRIVLGTLETL
jgi:hypothetical protein